VRNHGQERTRLRRARQTRIKIAELKVARLTVFARTRTSTLSVLALRHQGAGQRFDAEAEVRANWPSGKGGNVAAATLIGKRIAEKAKAAGVERWLRPLGLPLPRPRQGAGRCGPRSRPQVLSEGIRHGKDASESSG
jgi:large subunit ribosomal protein L18